MLDLELPIAKRTKWYRFWEMVPALLSYGMLALMIVLSFVNPLWASIYLLLLIITLLVRAIGIAYYSIRGHIKLTQARSIDWRQRLDDLEDPLVAFEKLSHRSKPDAIHEQNLRLISADPTQHPRPSEVFHLVIMAAYNESYDVIEPTLSSLVRTTTDPSQMIFVFAYEQRGGPEIAHTAQRLKKEYRHHFRDFIVTMHPDGLPDEIVGKGPNITYAAEQVEHQIRGLGIDFHNVIVTTLDCDNKPDPVYFDYVAYEFIVHEDRKQLSFQPISLYFGNLWEAPAPMRVIAIGNTFWTIISSVRPNILRNFAAHSQPLEALSEMRYWSKRSIVEDGHQYWRSYFYFGGSYNVVPIYVPVYQDAVMANTFKSTVITQFKQLRRWAYGASDVPYVAVRLFSSRRNVPFVAGVSRLLRLLDSHVSLATQAILVSIGGWIPLLINTDASRSIAAHNLPDLVSSLQRVALIGLFITIILSLRLLPARPGHIHRRRRFGMILQWILVPFISIGYNALASLNAQTHLLLGKYLDTFDVTEKKAVRGEKVERVE